MCLCAFDCTTCTGNVSLTLGVWLFQSNPGLKFNSLCLYLNTIKPSGIKSNDPDKISEEIFPNFDCYTLDYGGLSYTAFEPPALVFIESQLWGFSGEIVRPLAFQL